MSKRGKMFVIMLAVMIQVCLGVSYLFAKAPVSAAGCFVIWCICTVMICQLTKVPEIV